MSKYVIDIPNGVEWGVVTCRTEDGFYTRDFDSLEELNSDYINEHYGELQDTAYQRGLNDAWECARKIVCDDTCGGMSMKELVEIFNKSSDAYILRDFTAQQAIEMLKAHEQKRADKPIIGEVVERYLNGKRDGVGMFLGEDGDYWNCLFWTGAIFGTFAYPSNQFKRTGTVCDITKILEAMKA